MTLPFSAILPESHSFFVSDFMLSYKQLSFVNISFGLYKYNKY